METWKPVVGNFAGWPYEVSDQGRVRRKNRGRVLKIGHNPRGYAQVGLFIEKAHTTSVHKLVYEAFVGLISEMFEMNHINHIRDDNRLENLEMVSRNENCRKKIKKAGCSSKYTGVCITRSKTWSAYARDQTRKRVRLGHFSTEDEAARARDKFYRDSGMPATFNFPE